MSEQGWEPVFLGRKEGIRFSWNSRPMFFTLKERGREGWKSDDWGLREDAGKLDF